jgi:hypothetical protein
MRAFVVRSIDVFDRKKNPGLRLSVESILKNPRIPKHCRRCGAELTVLETYECGKENTTLACFRCDGEG